MLSKLKQNRETWLEMWNRKYQWQIKVRENGEMLYVFSKLCEAVYKNCHNLKASFKIACLEMSS